MVVLKKVEGYEEFLKVVKELESQTVYVLFSGSLDESGEGWCSDCVKAEPLIEEVVRRLPDSVNFLKVLVGDRAFWKDKNCPFRKDKRLRLTSVPTLMKWNGAERLEGGDFEKKEIIEMAFEEDL